MLAGDKIDIRCTKNQAAVIRNRLADWLDEYPDKTKKKQNDKDRIEEINDRRFLTGIDRHRGMCKEPGDMIRGGG
jgi:hypothetical protein